MSPLREYASADCPGWRIAGEVAQQDALTRLQEWLSSGWFAPNALKRLARPERINGVYLPFWTYYFHTDSHYIGERGEHYYETETDSSGNKHEVQHRLSHQTA
jgi:hypothetical protein